MEPQNPVNQNNSVFAIVTPPLSMPTWNTAGQILGGGKKATKPKAKAKPKTKK
jgi:hypothetical protein